MSTSADIDGVWNDDFQFDLDGLDGWFVFTRENGSNLDLGTSLVTGGSGTVYHGSLVKMEDVDSARQIV